MHPRFDEFVANSHSATAVAELQAALIEARGPLRRQVSNDTAELTFVWVGEAKSVSLQCGLLEDGPLSLSPGVSHLVANRHFRDVAVARGHEVIYDELTTAHDLAAFRVAVMRGLVALLPGGAS